VADGNKHASLQHSLVNYSSVELCGEDRSPQKSHILKILRKMERLAVGKQPADWQK